MHHYAQSSSIIHCLMIADFHLRPGGAAARTWRRRQADESIMMHTSMNDS